MMYRRKSNRLENRIFVVCKTGIVSNIRRYRNNNF